MEWEIQIVIYDIMGRLVKTLFTGRAKPGSYRVIWNGKDHRGQLVPSGIYIVELYTKGFVQRRKAVLVR